MTAFALSLVLLNYAPSLNKHAEQDSCSFGPISNKEYREILSKAKTLLAPISPSIVMNTEQNVSKLSETYQTLTEGDASVYKQILVMHAVIRAAGGQYRNANDLAGQNPFERALMGSDLITLNYAITTNNLLLIWPWPHETWVLALLAGPHYGQFVGPRSLKKPRDVTFVINAPEPRLMLRGFEIPANGNCPPVPREELAPRFNSTSG